LEKGKWLLQGILDKKWSMVANPTELFLSTMINFWFKLKATASMDHAVSQLNLVS
jgi:hypothetical protein